MSLTQLRLPAFTLAPLPTRLANCHVLRLMLPKPPKHVSLRGLAVGQSADHGHSVRLFRGIIVVGPVLSKLRFFHA